MNPSEEKLLSFYFGSTSEDDRYRIEQDLLTDPEALLNYLDLKRKIEQAELVPQVPSQKLWSRLRPQTISKRGKLISLGFGLAMAASIAFFSISRFKEPQNTDSGEKRSQILFDSNFEQPTGSSVF